MSSPSLPLQPVNVRLLAEFCHETGDLTAGAQLISRMVDGAKAHRALQKTYPQGFQSEVTIRMEAEALGIAFLVQGRMDGLDMQGPVPIVDEIKTTQQDPFLIVEDGYPEHWAQVLIYAHMLCENHGHARVRARLSYYNTDGRLNVYERECDRAGLAAHFDMCLLRWAEWVRANQQWREVRDGSIANLAFPFEQYRDGQREMAKNVYVALREGKNLLVQAPTGIGKTVAALFPALKMLGEGGIERIFYLTARTTTRQVAESAIERMRGMGLMLRSVTLTAKDKLCLHPGERCSPMLCERARGYFDRRRAALYEALSLTKLTREHIEALSDKHCLCPHEFSLDLSEIADVVICDYNHAFDPRVKLKRFFLDGGPYALLIDEAHNLIDRGRDMLSAELSSRMFSDVRRDVGKSLGRKHALYKALGALIQDFKQLREQYDEPACELEPPEALGASLQPFVELASEALFSEGCPGALSDAFWAALSYIRALDLYDEQYRALLLPEGRALRVKLWCYDPAPYLSGCMRRVRATALFSATLSPMGYYRDALGLSEAEGDALLDLPSPFPRENLLVLRLPIATRYRSRQASAPQVAEAILTMCRAKVGNYLACFPSHAYLNQVRELLEEQGVRLLVQRGAMDDTARAQFIGEFVDGPGESMLALIAMGGIFAEGIDLPGERLSGAAIVGVGIPQIGFEREQLRLLVDDGEVDGYRCAYTYPGIERVLQAAGRVIRTETDRGALLLIDDRFGTQEYRALLPPHWHVRQSATGQVLQAHLRDFWGRDATGNI